MANKFLTLNLDPTTNKILIFGSDALTWQDILAVRDADNDPLFFSTILRDSADFGEGDDRHRLKKFEAELMHFDYFSDISLIYNQCYDQINTESETPDEELSHD